MPPIENIKKRQFTKSLNSFKIDGVPFSFQPSGSFSPIVSGVITKTNEATGKVSQLCCDEPSLGVRFSGTIEYLTPIAAKCALERYSKGKYRITGSEIPCDMTAYMVAKNNGRIVKCGQCWQVEWEFIQADSTCNQ